MNFCYKWPGLCVSEGESQVRGSPRVLCPPRGGLDPSPSPSPTAAVASRLPALLLGVQCALNRLRGSHAQGPGPLP